MKNLQLHKKDTTVNGHGGVYDIYIYMNKHSDRPTPCIHITQRLSRKHK